MTLNQLICFFIAMLNLSRGFIHSNSRWLHRRSEIDLSITTTNNDPSCFPSGIFGVYKPKTWTSNDVVSKLKRTILNEIRGRNQTVQVKSNEIKVGHGGTLDPMAEGVLVIGVNRGTKHLHTYLAGAKEYDVVGKFGTSTDTYDSTGTVVGFKEYDHIHRIVLQDTIKNNFIGEISQIPPMYSALKHNGKRLYQYAREGITLERPARKVDVYDVQHIEDSQNVFPEYFRLHIKCGGGFYVRTLIHDLGIELNTFAHMTSLVRTKQGPFTISDCLTQESWNVESIRKAMVPINS